MEFVCPVGQFWTVFQFRLGFLQKVIGIDIRISATCVPTCKSANRSNYQYLRRFKVLRRIKEIVDIRTPIKGVITAMSWKTEQESEV